MELNGWDMAHITMRTWVCFLASDKRKGKKKEETEYEKGEKLYVLWVKIIENDVCIPMFNAVLFTVAGTWQWPGCLVIDD